MKFRMDCMSDKCSNYWQGVLRFGLPFVLLYRLANYAVFLLTVGDQGIRYDWWANCLWDILLLFVVSTLWWLFMREVNSVRKKRHRKLI
jgi:hypothetical protein